MSFGDVRGMKWLVRMPGIDSKELIQKIIDIFISFSIDRKQHIA